MWFGLDKIFKEEDENFPPVYSTLDNIYKLLLEISELEQIHINFEHDNNNYLIGMKKNKKYFLNDSEFYTIDELFSLAKIGEISLKNFDRIIEVSDCNIENTNEEL